MYCIVADGESGNIKPRMCASYVNQTIIQQYAQFNVIYLSEVFLSKT